MTTFAGERLRLSDLRGQIVVINFWASWCAPCREEAPVLEAAWREYRDRGVIILGLDWADTEQEALAYLEEFQITYPNGPDLGTRIAQAYRMRGIPETFFVDSRGELRGVVIGAIDEPELQQRIENLLAEDS